MTRRPPPTRIVLPPELPFSAVHAAFVDGGWVGGPITLTPPMVAGEPELARYRLADLVATYTADPVVWLRVVTSSVPLPAGLLPRLSGRTLLRWLRDDAPDEETRERRLLAVMASAEIRLDRAGPELRRIAASDDPLLAEAARRAERTRPR